MDQGDPRPKMSINDNNNYQPEHGEATAEIPPFVGPERPPQRNDDNATCHCGNCACPCAQAGGGHGGGGGLGAGSAQAVKTEPGHKDPPSKASSEAGDRVDDGDEGAEDHLIEVGDFGYIPLSLIHRTLAKHARCTCHGVLPNADDYPFTNRSSPIISGMVSPGDSMFVEPSSGEPSMASSGLFGLRSRGSSVFDFVHSGGFDHEAFLERLPTLFNPLPLTAEVPYSMELSISSISERDYSVPADEFSDYDMW